LLFPWQRGQNIHDRLGSKCSPQESALMQELTSLLGIAAAISIGAASPSPSFVMVARTAASSRSDGLGAALGMGLGGLAFALASLLGLHGLLLAVPSFFWMLQVAGGLYLAYLGIRIWRGAKTPLATAPVQSKSGSATAVRSLALGLATQLSNPKTAIVYASVFAAFLPATTSLLFNLAIASLVFAIEAGWYALVALALSSIGPRTRYLRHKTWMDRAAGGVMVALGVKLVFFAHHP